MGMTQEWISGRREVSATVSSGEVKGKEIGSPDYSRNSSGLEGKVGSTAIWVKEGTTHRTIQFHLGKFSDHTIYESKLVGIILALEIICKAGCTMPHPICISLDNQAAIKASTLSRPAPGQYLIRALTCTALRIQQANPSTHKITLQWVVGHNDVIGNELADAVAKEAA